MRHFKWLSLVWKETGQRKNKFYIRLTEKLDGQTIRAVNIFLKNLLKTSICNPGLTPSSGRRLEIK